jgi:hypothetical protein
MQHDALVRFVLENQPVRGEIVYLDESYREVMNRHPYPPAIQQLLGQLLAGSSLLSATLKYRVMGLFLYCSLKLILRDISEGWRSGRVKFLMILIKLWVRAN